MFGDTGDGPKLFSLMKSGESIKGREKELLLGFTGNAGAVSTEQRLAQLADDEIICGCNGVSKETIKDAILTKNCNTVASVKACTKASGSCGGRKPLVEGLVQLYAGDAKRGTRKRRDMRVYFARTG